MPRWKKVVWILIIALVTSSVFAGIKDGVSGWSEAKGSGEKIVELLSILYGIAGILALLMLRSRSASSFYTLVVWAILVEACGTLAATVYAEEARWIAGIFAALSVAAPLIPVLLFVRKEMIIQK